MTRNGKIARLPKHIREQLNLRLQDGEPGKQLVEWLNQLPKVKQVLAELFGARPINEQNLTEWKQGGHQDWLHDQEARERVQRLVDRVETLDDVDSMEISDRLATVLAAELADAAQKLHEIADPKERWQRLREILQELSRLRSGDHKAKGLQLKREQWERNIEREDDEEEKRAEEESKNRFHSMLVDRLSQDLMVKAFGGGEFGEKCVDVLLRAKHGLPMPDWCNPDKQGPDSPEKIKLNQTESN